MKDYGTVTYKGIKYTLQQEPCADNYGTDGGIRYYARATGPDGEEYQVAWDTTEEWDKAVEYYKLLDASYLDDEQQARLTELETMVLVDLSDESNACDWDHPVSVRII